MRGARFWLTEAQFAKIAPHLPTDTRGKKRVDDRRVISGIIHVLASGCRWAYSPSDWSEEDALQPLCVMAAAIHTAATAGVVKPSAIRTAACSRSDSELSGPIG